MFLFDSSALCLVGCLCTELNNHNNTILLQLTQIVAVRQHTKRRVSLWLNGAIRSWPDRHFPWTKSLLLPQLSDGAFAVSISDTTDLFSLVFLPPPFYRPQRLQQCLEARLETSSHQVTGRCGVRQTVIGMFSLCWVVCVIVTHSLSLWSSGCEAEKEEDVCLVADSAQLRSEEEDCSLALWRGAGSTCSLQHPLQHLSTLSLGQSCVLFFWSSSHPF